MIRYKFIIGFIIVITFILLIRIFQIAVGHSEYYDRLAMQNIIKKDWVIPIRGEIVDRNGQPLAVNRIGFSLNLAPHLRANVLKESAEFMAKKFDLDKENIKRRYRQQNSFYNHDLIEVAPFIEYDLMMPYISMLEREPFITVQPATLREYPLADAAAHVLGYVGRYAGEGDDTARRIGVIGKTGLEKSYNEHLQGELGYERVKVNASNERVELLEYVAPKENKRLELTIDAKLQKYLKELYEDKSGAAIVMDTDGKILGALSYPAYDPNLFVTGISQSDWDAIRFDFDNPFTNKFSNGLYPPGSVIKMQVGLSFFDAGDVTENSSVVCESNFELGGHVFRCWDRDGHGRVDFLRAIRESCDDYFYKNSLNTGINKIAEVLREVGLGERTGVDLDNEAYGTVPDIPWKHRRHNQRWYQGETIISSIGQGYMLTTPLQIARTTAAMATNKLPTPHFVATKQMQKSAYEPEVIQANPQTMDLIRESMREVVTHPKGTARWNTRQARVDMAAKTGTAQVVSIPQDQKERMDPEEVEFYDRSHAWFTAYAPYDDPKYVVTILVEHGASGSAVGGPMSAKIFNWLADNGYIKD